VLAVAYRQLDRSEDARAMMAKGLELRPGSTTANFVLPRKNASPAFIVASERMVQILAALGLPVMSA